MVIIGLINLFSTDFLTILIAPFKAAFVQSDCAAQLQHNSLIFDQVILAVSDIF